MSAIGSNVGVITLVQNDLDGAQAFYRRVFRQEADFADADVAVFHFENTIIKLETESAAERRIATATLPAQAAGSRVVLTIWVDDANAACAELAERGVTLISGPTDTPWGTRNAHFADPGGHIWGIAQDLDPQAGS